MEPLVGRSAHGSGIGRTGGGGKTGASGIVKIRSGRGTRGILAGQMRHGDQLAVGRRSTSRRKIRLPLIESQIPVGFFELPGSDKVFNINNQAWETRSEDENPRVPFLSLAGRVGMVSKESAQQEAAFQLLVWLSNEQNSPQISPPARQPRCFGIRI